MSLVGNLLVGILDVGKAVVDRTLDFAYVLLAKFDFEGSRIRFPWSGCRIRDCYEHCRAADDSAR